MSATTVRAAGGRRKLPTKWATIILFLGPPLILYVVFVLFPVVQAARYSLYNWNGLGALTDFVGLDNYARVIGSEVFKRSVSNNLLIVGLSLAIQIPFSLMLAILLNGRFPGRAVFRLIFFLPYVISEAITGINRASPNERAARAFHLVIRFS